MTESRLFSQSRAHCRCASRHCSPCSGNGKGSVENAVGLPRRNLPEPEPEPSVSSLAELNGTLRGGCERVNAPSRRRDMPAGLVPAIDRCGKADRRRAPRAISRAAERSGSGAACAAAERVFASGRVPDDASCDLLARRVADGAAERGGADLAVHDLLAEGALRDACQRVPGRAGGGDRQAVLAHEVGVGGLGAARHAPPGGVPARLPRGRGCQPRRPPSAPRCSGAARSRRPRPSTATAGRRSRGPRASDARACCPRRSSRQGRTSCSWATPAPGRPAWPRPCA